MRYDQIDLALTFLTEPSDAIVLQVPYVRDIATVNDYVMSRFGPIVKQRTLTNMTLLGGATIRLEWAGSDTAGIGYACPIFLIERANDPHIPGVVYA